MHDRPAIRSEFEEGASIRGVARARGASRNAVRRAVAPGARDHYWRPSPTEGDEPAVRKVLADYPHMAAKDVAAVAGWQHSYRALAALVARLRPEYLDGPGVRARPLSSLRRGRLGGVTRISAGRVVLRGQAQVGARLRTGTAREPA